MLLQVNRALSVVSLCMVLVSLFTGCSLAPAKPIQLPALAKPVDLSDDSKIKSLLLSQYHLWKGTPYEYGGNNLDGVDCSAFVQNTYRSKLGYAIPRTTKSQIKIGTKVSKNSLKIGDIVFFKTGKNALHNGIYIGNSRFVHASSLKGVTISSLDNVYWKKTYYTSKRIR